MKFYEIIRKKDGGILYHEFAARYGKVSDALDDVYVDFYSEASAREFGKARGAIDAFGY